MWPCGLSPLHLVEADVPGVQLPGCQEGDLGVCGSGSMVTLTGTAWDLPPALVSKGIAAETGPLPSRGSKLDPGLRDASKRFPASLQVTPAPGRWSSRSAPVSQAAPHSDLQRQCHRELGSCHTQLSHIFLGPFPSQKCTEKEILGKVAPAWRVWHLLKPPWAGILLSCLFTDESESPKPKIVPAWHMLLLLLLLSHVSRVRLCATP